MKLSAPRNVSFGIAAALYAVALANYFGVVHLSNNLGSLAWIIGFGLLLVACFFKGL